MVRVNIFGKKIEAEKLEQAAAVALLVISFAAPALVKPFIDTFAFGTSYARVYGFAAYVVLLAFSAMIIKLIFGKNLISGPRVDEKVVIGLLLVVFAYGFVGQYFFVSSLGGEINTKYYAYSPQGFTSSHITHNHALKTIFCPLGLPPDEFDCASPMLPYLPQFYNYVGILIVAAASLACAAFYPNMKTNSDKIAYIILSFASLKTAVDGGIFNFENIAMFMLVPFLLAKEKKLVYTLAGAIIWFPVVSSIYLFYEPLRLAIPMLMFFYSVCIFMMNPRYLFPVLIFALVAPTYVLTYSDVVVDRWSPEPCKNAGANERLDQAAIARLYTPCETNQALLCGNVTAANGTAMYSGFSLRKPELVLSKALAEKCGNGVFSIQEVRGTLKVIERN